MGMSNHKMLLILMIRGDARWEPFSEDPIRGEVCIGGLRYATELDSDGSPRCHAIISSALKRQLFNESEAPNE